MTPRVLPATIAFALINGAAIGLVGHSAGWINGIAVGPGGVVVERGMWGIAIGAWATCRTAPCEA